jgi:hypothetical protein
MVVREIKLCTLSFLRVELVSTGVPLEVMLLLVLGGFAVAVEVCSCCPQCCCHARKAAAVAVCCYAQQLCCCSLLGSGCFCCVSLGQTCVRLSAVFSPAFSWGSFLF